MSISARDSISTKGGFTRELFAFLAVADAIRTSLGPKGMDKMVSDSHM